MQATVFILQERREIKEANERRGLNGKKFTKINTRGDYIAKKDLGIKNDGAAKATTVKPKYSFSITHYIEKSNLKNSINLISVKGMLRTRCALDRNNDLCGVVTRRAKPPNPQKGLLDNV